MKYYKFSIIFDIISIFVVFSSFIWIFVEMKYFSYLYDSVLNHLFSQDFRPIQKLKLSRSECQEGNYHNLLNYVFLGVSENCYDYSSGKFLNKTCKDDSSNKLKIEGIPAKNLSVWRNRILCTKDFNPEKDDYMFINIGKDCEEPYKKCGKINKDSTVGKIEKIFCLKNYLECPLNYLDITKDITKYDNNNGEFDIYSFNNNYYLVTSNKKIDDPIIVNIKLSQGIYPCYEKELFSNTTPQFPGLVSINEFNCGIKYDNVKSNLSEINLTTLVEDGYDIRYNQLDKMAKIDFLIDNDVDYAYGKLPNISYWKQDIYDSYFNLFYTNSFSMKEECSSYEEIESSIIYINKVHSGRLIFALSHVVIYVIFFSLLRLIKVILTFSLTLVFGIKIAFTYIIFIINIALILSCRTKLYVLEKSESLKDCLDMVSNNILKNINMKTIISEMKEEFFYERIIWYVYIGLNFIDTFKFIRRFYKRRKNAPRRKLAREEIGVEKLQKIFAKVRRELEKKRGN